MGRRRRRRTRVIGSIAGTICLTGLLTSCSLFSTQPTRDLARASELPPEAAAWLVADVCRTEIPSADPDPSHADPLVVHLGERTYLVRYTRHPSQGFRVFCNGRIRRPHLGSAPTGRHASPLRGCRFSPASALTRDFTTGTQEARIEVSPGEQGGSQIRIRLRGRIADGALTTHLVQALDTADAIERSARLLEEESFEQAEAVASAALDLFGSGCCGRHHELAARLQFHRAMAASARQDLPSLRGRLSLALVSAPGFVAAKTRLDQSILRLGDRSADPGTLEIEAAALLEEGDLAGAAHVAKRALARSKDALEAHRILAELCTRHGNHRMALAEKIIILHRAGFTPNLVLDMVRLYATLGNEPAGVRLLSRYQRQLAATAAAETRTLLATIGAGDELTRRILLSSDSTPQTRLALNIENRTDPDRPLLSRVEELRRIHFGRVLYDSRHPGYWTAPGVFPLK